MTRPQIIRACTATVPYYSLYIARQYLHPRILTLGADTIDLQDKSSPTAQDHSHQPQHPAPLGIGPAAPHQQASLKLVEDERSAEEARLQHAWSNAGNSLSEDPGSDDDRTVMTTTNGQKPRQNGDAHDDDDDMQDADVEEDMDDDDMLDKMSSSPSIDDGGYPSPSSPLVWPVRKDSLTPISSPAASSTASSSPFTSTPVHFPIPVPSAGRPYSFPASGADDRSDSSHHSSPLPYQFHFSQSPSKSQSTEHHRGEYPWRTNYSMNDITTATFDQDVSPRTKHWRLVERRLQQTRDDSLASLISDMDEDDAKKMLAPVQPPSSHLPEDPFVEAPLLIPRSTNGTPPLSFIPDEDDDSWTTDSDADSWNEDLDSDDDASNDALFSDDSRFIDSGWGGECLRETEDIDFEFVYALHTFVATVEGQANATKGDTMVLLDDSNSYWWLVRVVKDSSIGEYTEH